MAQKLWRASVIQGHKNPFGKPLVEYTAAELDFVLEMEAIDNPREFTFVRNGVSTNNAHVAASRAAWLSVLRGKDRLEFTRGLPFDKVAAYHKRKAAGGGQGGMKPGLRKGKPRGKGKEA